MTTNADRSAEPAPGEVKELGIAGSDLYDESLKPGAAVADLSPGMAVVTADDHALGVAKAVRANCLVVQRRGRPDLYVPHDSVLEGRRGRMVVNTLENQLDRLGWETPPSG